MSVSFELGIRRATEADTAYMAKTWLKAFRHQVRLSTQDYYAVHRPLVTGLISRCGAWIAHPSDDPETILGFCVSEGAPLGQGTCHWLYVRDAWRGNGIARALAAAAGLTEGSVFTHWSEDAELLVRRFRGLVYYPYAVEAHP